MSIFSDVHEKVSLEGFLREQGFDLIRFDSGLRSRRCVSAACGSDAKTSPKMRLSVRGEFWRCWSCGEKGDVSKAAALLWGIRQDAAAKRLLQDTARSSALSLVATARTAQIPASVAQQRALESVIRSLRSEPMMSAEVLAFLAGRGVRQDVAERAAQSGVIVGLPGEPDRARARLENLVGRDQLCAAGLWRPEAPYPALAFRPLLGLLGSSGIEAIKASAALPDDPSGPSMLRYGEAREPYALRTDAWRSDDDWFVVNGILETLAIKSIVSSKTSVMGIPGSTSWRVGSDAGVRSEWFGSLTGKRVTVVLRDEQAQANPVESHALAHALYRRGIRVQNLSSEDLPVSQDCLV